MMFTDIEHARYIKRFNIQPDEELDRLTAAVKFCHVS